MVPKTANTSTSYPAKLRDDLRSVPFWVNSELDLASWQKPPDVREFIYADAKALFEKHQWHEAYAKFEETLTMVSACSCVRIFCVAHPQQS